MADLKLVRNIAGTDEYYGRWRKFNDDIYFIMHNYMYDVDMALAELLPQTLRGHGNENFIHPAPIFGAIYSAHLHYLQAIPASKMAASTELVTCVPALFWCSI